MNLFKKAFLVIVLFLAFGLFAKNNSKAWLKIKSFPLNAAILINGEPKKFSLEEETTKKIYLEKGKYTLSFTAEGYYDKTLTVLLDQEVFLENKLEKKDSHLALLKEIETGKQPKSIAFTPDGNYLVVPLLDDNGVDIISVRDLKKIKRIEFPEKYASKKGFVESAFSIQKNELWISQMWANVIHVIDLKDFSYKKTIQTGGKFSKVILFSDNEKTVFVSNWISEDISVIDTENYKLIKKIKTDGIPRGMLMSPDGKYLYACIFDKGKIEKIDLATGKTIKVLSPGSALRHVVADKSKNLFYASAMGSGQIIVVSFQNDKVIKKIKVGDKPNTIQLSADKKFLFISTRGPNNRKSYLLKGPIFGKVFVMNTENFEIKDWIWGKNQPTGLDVSPDNKYLAFTDFLDQNIEIYAIKPDLWN